MAVTLDELTSRYEQLFDAFEHAGFDLYLVGGCVRDVAMGLDSVGDVDLATDATPDETSEVLAENGLKVIPIGARFGTIATLFGSEQVEITTFRVAEEYEPTSRKPVVQFGAKLEDDLSRRDLSINAMAAGRGGRVVDPFNGREAIEAGILEVPGGGRAHTESILRDDPLRLLRIARFAARFGFTPTNETTAAARETASELQHISRERWKMEMDKMLVAPSVAQALKWLHDIGALAVILPDATNLNSSDESVGVDALGAVLTSAPADRAVRWALLRLWLTTVRETGLRPDYSAPLPLVEAELREDDAETTAREFRFSNDERHALRFHCRSDARLDDIRPPWNRLRRRRWIYDQMQYGDSLISVIASLSNHPKAHDWAQTARTELKKAESYEDIAPVLPDGFGRDVIGLFLLDRGPAISSAIDFVKGAIVDGTLENGADAETYLAFLSRHEWKWRGEGD